MNIPYDATIHYILVHLHPFAESLELVDITKNKRVFRAKVKNFTDKVGLKKISIFKSKKGIPIYKDHDYELISIYNNTSNEDQDAMAVMYIFLRDKTFDLVKARQELTKRRSENPR